MPDAAIFKVSTQDAVTTEAARKHQGRSSCACVPFSNTHFFFVFIWVCSFFLSLNACILFSFRDTLLPT